METNTKDTFSSNCVFIIDSRYKRKQRSLEPKEREKESERPKLRQPTTAIP
jgi:hypothetical protein